MSRYFSACFFLFLVWAGAAQETIVVEPFEKSLRAKKTYYKNPSQLVELITADKTTEAEKFQSIFYWVVNNIDYDYWSYLSKSGRGASPISEVLKYRVALCGDFANLMDTLCLMAGIQSKRVNGYVKDELFDVHDSIYISNHAWNIVRLNNLWYPYDVTWSLGSTAWRFTRFSQWVVNQRQKLRYKTVRVRVKDKSRRYYKGISCPADERAEDDESKFIYKYKYKRKLWKWLLFRLPVRIEMGYKESKSTDFFLSDPEVFAITHAPEDPRFSLVRNRRITDFEGDSGYYHLTKSQYGQQNRNGRTCSDCLSSSDVSMFDKAARLKQQTLGFNKKNTFTVALCEYSMAVSIFNESVPLQDSAAKIELLDSALFLLEESKRSLGKAANGVRESFDEQKQKNRNKYNLLREGIEYDRRFIREQMQRVFNETRDIRDLEHSLMVDWRTFKYRQRTLKNYKDSKQIKKENRFVQRTIDLLSDDLEKINRYTDSLNDMIDSTRILFSASVPDLSNRIWQRVTEQDSLMAPLNRRMNLRNAFSDDYKKPVVVETDSLRHRQIRYGANVDSLILKPGQVCYEAGKKISALVRERNQARLMGYRLRYQLYQFNAMQAVEFDGYLKTLHEENKNDACWIRNNSVALPRVFYGFKSMNNHHEAFEKKLVAERKLEGMRYSLTERELSRRKQQRSNTISHNRRVMIWEAKKVKKSKREFLKALREQRRQERASAKD